MIILVTGGTGLVGQSLQKIKKDFSIYSFHFLGSRDVDLTSYEDTKKKFNQIHPTMVIHLAACVGGLFKNMNYKVDMYEKNTLINLNVSS